VISTLSHCTRSPRTCVESFAFLISVESSATKDCVRLAPTHLCQAVVRSFSEQHNIVGCSNNGLRFLTAFASTYSSVPIERSPPRNRFAPQPVQYAEPSFLTNITERDAAFSEMRDWFYPQFSGCSCCRGYVYSCGDQTCLSLGMCGCASAMQYPMHDDFEGLDARFAEYETSPGAATDYFYPISASCQCCRGYIHSCNGANCRRRGACLCAYGTH
jgi:hypothetical protein